MRILRLAALAALLTTGSAYAQAPITLKFSVDTPAAGETWKQMLAPWAKKVEDASAGSLKIETYTDGMLSKNGDTIVRVAAGIADIGWDLPLVYGLRFGSLGVVALPGVYSDPEPAARAMWRMFAKGQIGTEMSDLKVLFLQVTPQTAFYLRALPKSNVDLTGVKVALSSKQRAEIVQGMNGTPLAMTPPEYYQSVQKGVIDGAMTTVGALQAFKVDELLHGYLYGPFGGGVTALVMNKAKYESLPPAAKKAIDANSGEDTSAWAAAWLRDYENGYLNGTMLKVPGNTKVTLSDAEVAKWRPVFDKVIEDWVKTTPNGKAVIDGYKAELAK